MPLSIVTHTYRSEARSKAKLAVTASRFDRQSTWDYLSNPDGS